MTRPMNYDTLSDVRIDLIISICVDNQFELCVMFIPVIVNRKNKQNMTRTKTEH